MKKRGVALPKNQKKTPQFCASLMFYWDSFWELNTTRHELGQIPWGAINDYCYRWNMTDLNEFDSFVYFVRGLDSAFLHIKNNEIQKKRDMVSTKNKLKGKRK